MLSVQFQHGLGSDLHSSGFPASIDPKLLPFCKQMGELGVGLSSEPKRLGLLDPFMEMVRVGCAGGVIFGQTGIGGGAPAKTGNEFRGLSLRKTSLGLVAMLPEKPKLLPRRGLIGPVHRTETCGSS